MVTVQTIPEEFFVELAVGVATFDEVCDNYGIDKPTANLLEKDPVFTRRLRQARQVVEDDGSAFKARCKTAVANSVHSVIHMISDPDCPATVQLDAFKS